MKDKNMTVEEIRERKRQLGWTNAELAAKSGIPVSTVAKILGGTTQKPHKTSLKAIEQVLFSSSSLDENSAVSGNGESTRKGGDAAAISYTTDHFSNGNRLRMVREPQYVYGSGAMRQQEPDRMVKGPGNYTIDDYLALPSERRVELIDGRFYDMAAPSWIHQKTVFHIWKTIDACIEEHQAGCEVMGAPYDVQLFNDPYTVVEPDVMIFCGVPEKELSVRAHTVPAFIAEVLSPSTAFRDRTQKLCRYRDASVKEVWLVSPAAQKIWVYRFYDGREEPDEYTFHDSVPLGISDSRCSVEFSKLLRYVEQ